MNNYLLQLVIIGIENVLDLVIGFLMLLILMSKLSKSRLVPKNNRSIQLLVWFKTLTELFDLEVGLKL